MLSIIASNNKHKSIISRQHHSIIIHLETNDDIRVWTIGNLEVPVGKLGGECYIKLTRTQNIVKLPAFSTEVASCRRKVVMLSTFVSCFVSLVRCLLLLISYF